MVWIDSTVRCPKGANSPSAGVMMASCSTVAMTAAIPLAKCTGTWALAVSCSLIFSSAVKYIACAGPAPSAMAFRPRRGRKTPSSRTMVANTRRMLLCCFSHIRDCMRVCG